MLTAPAASAAATGQDDPAASSRWLSAIAKLRRWQKKDS
jgi:hypothetical protein